MTAALDIDRVSHNFGAVQALSEVSLNVPRGGFTALLGVNGAGKTTLAGKLAHWLKGQG
ncbi:MAG TPA: ATP-binding cassette domain-containing protein, partial [Paracoccus sp. (in: a-proteobacteria)]|nr:ATP-binding cassette domain-containing protein [Paracoccus sp. (in: a-proteobacteria)]